jgi:hypothetical protein
MTDGLPTREHNDRSRGKTRWWFVALLLAIGLVALAKGLAL